jgi:hypothetical protein
LTPLEGARSKRQTQSRAADVLIKLCRHNGRPDSLPPSSQSRSSRASSPPPSPPAWTLPTHSPPAASPPSPGAAPDRRRYGRPATTTPSPGDGPRAGARGADTRSRPARRSPARPPADLQVGIGVDGRLRREMANRRGAAAPTARTVSRRSVRQYLRRPAPTRARCSRPRRPDVAPLSLRAKDPDRPIVIGDDRAAALV